MVKKGRRGRVPKYVEYARPRHFAPKGYIICDWCGTGMQYKPFQFFHDKCGEPPGRYPKTLPWKKGKKGKNGR